MACKGKKWSDVHCLLALSILCDQTEAAQSERKPQDGRWYSNVAEKIRLKFEKDKLHPVKLNGPVLKEKISQWKTGYQVREKTML